MSIQRSYPGHFLLSRRYAMPLVEQFERQGGSPGHEAAGEQVRNAVMHDFIAALTQPGLVANLGAFTSEVNLATSLVEWWLQGRVLLSLTPELAEAFLHSAIDELRLVDVLPAQRCGFLQFTRPELVFPDTGARVEGVYWHHAPGISLRFVLVGRTDGDYLGRAFEGYQLLWKRDTWEVGAEDAMDLALAEDIQDLRRAQGQLAEARPALQASALAGSEAAIARHYAYRTLLPQVLRLVLNGLAYAKAYPDDQLRGWPEAAPERLRRQSADPAPKQRSRAQSKLWHLGWFEQTVIGDAFSHDRHAEHPQGSPTPHWRRGHWRNQAHGPQLSLRKLIWLRPMRILGAGTDIQPTAPGPRSPAP